MNEWISECNPFGKEKKVMIGHESLKSFVDKSVKQNVCGERKERTCLVEDKGKPITVEL